MTRTEDVDAAIERSLNDWYHPMAREDRRLLAEEVVRLRARVGRLAQDRYDAVAVIAALLPDRAMDGTAHHAALVAKNEIERLNELNIGLMTNIRDYEEGSNQP